MGQDDLNETVLLFGGGEGRGWLDEEQFSERLPGLDRVHVKVEAGVQELIIRLGRPILGQY